MQERGSVVPAANCPARVTAWVTGHVYDTSTGKFLLAPQGARSTGSFDSRVAFSRRSGEGSAHDASASAEVVAGPKICLYWKRDSRHAAGLRGCGAAAGLA
jgi:hypothetical protein